MKKIFAAVISLGMALIAAPALAGNVTIHYAGVRQVAYQMACVQHNNHVRPAHTVHQAPGSIRVFGHAGCVTFNIEIETLRGKTSHYELRAGRRYRLFYSPRTSSWQFSGD